MKLTNLNVLPVPTWRWLKMNQTELEITHNLDTPYDGAVLQRAELAKQQLAVEPSYIPDLPDDMAALRQFVEAHKNYELTLTIPKGEIFVEPIVLNFVLNEENPVLIDHLVVNAEAGSEAHIIVRYHNTDKTAAFHAGFTTLHAAPWSAVRISKIQALGHADQHLDGAAIALAANSTGYVTLFELGAKNIVASANVALKGDGSTGGIDSLYLGTDTQTRDLSYRLALSGKKVDGLILSKGALNGHATKTLKSTLDFASGTKGSSGVEQETVMTLSKYVQNRSVPLLLAGESDVEGAHATTSGKPDPNLLYYLMSRGFNEREATLLLVEASLTEILDKLPPSERESVKQKIAQVVHDDH